VLYTADLISLIESYGLMHVLIVGSISLLFVCLTYGTVYLMKSFPLTSYRGSKLI